MSPMLTTKVPGMGSALIQVLLPVRGEVVWTLEGVRGGVGEEEVRQP
jgi:hypothetical protein